MSELAAFAPDNAVATIAPDLSTLPRAAQSLVEWARAASAAHALALSLVRTSFCPEQYRNKPGEATAAILAGAEVGLSPIASLRSFDNIEGTAAPRALTQRAVVQSLGHELIITESSPTRARGKGRRRDSTEWQHVEWTIDRARQLGLVDRKTKSGKPSPWKTQPTSMLVARVTGELARLVAADAILGIGYSAEEVEDAREAFIAVAPEPRSQRVQRRRKVVDAPLPADPEPVVEAEPEFDDDQADDRDDGGNDAITDPQNRLLHKLLRERFGDDHDTWLNEISETIHHPVDSTNELTVAEASLVIDRLDPDPPEEP